MACVKRGLSLKGLNLSNGLYVDFITFVTLPFNDDIYRTKIVIHTDIAI